MEVTPVNNNPAAVDEVLSGHWAEGELRFLLNYQILTAETLNPEGALTRAEAVKLLIDVYGQFLQSRVFTQGVEVPYTNVTVDDAHYVAVSHAVRLGVLRPEGESPAFGGDRQISRAEFAVWLVRIMELGELAQSDLQTVPTFTDGAELTPEQRKAVAFLEVLEIIPSGGAFRGTEPLTQAEAAAMVIRTLEYLR